VSLFVLSPEIEDRDEVEVDNWAKHKKTFYFYSEQYIFSELQYFYKLSKKTQNRYLTYLSSLFYSADSAFLYLYFTRH
jgi:hypothetical protein